MSVYPYRVQPFNGGAPSANTKHATPSAAAQVVYAWLWKGREIVHVLYEGHSIARFGSVDTARDIVPDIQAGAQAARQLRPVPRGQRRREVQEILAGELGGDWSRAYDVLERLKPYLK